MAMLEKSVQDAQATRSEPASVHPMPTRKKTAAKKTGTDGAKKTATQRKPRSA